MGTSKDHEEKKKRNYDRRTTKSADRSLAQKEDLDQEILDNIIALNREKAAPVEGYKPLFKELLKLYPIEKRY